MIMNRHSESLELKSEVDPATLEEEGAGSSGSRLRGMGYEEQREALSPDAQPSFEEQQASFAPPKKADGRMVSRVKRFMYFLKRGDVGKLTSLITMCYRSYKKSPSKTSDFISKLGVALKAHKGWEDGDYINFVDAIDDVKTRGFQKSGFKRDLRKLHKHLPYGH